MAMNNPYNQYFENQLKTATPGKLLVMTYDAAIRFAKLALEKMREHKLDEQSANIRKVQNVLLELTSTLNRSADPQLASNLSNLYSFMFDQLTRANIKDDPQAIETVIDMLSEMREVWVEAELMVRSGENTRELNAA